MSLADEKERILKEHGSYSEEYRFCECIMLVRMKYKARHEYLNGVEKHRGMKEKIRLYTKSFEYHRIGKVKDVIDG